MNKIVKSTNYHNWIGELKQQIQRSQIKATLSVNSQCRSTLATIQKKKITETNKNTERKNVMRINYLTGKIIGCAIEVHRALGAGLLESAYEEYCIKTNKKDERK